MKTYVYAGIVLALIAAGAGASRFFYKAGYNKRALELSTELIEQQNAAIQKGIDDWIATQAAAEPVIKIEEKIVEKIRVIEKRIPVVVDNIVEVRPECRDLGPDYVSLLNDQVAASNTVIAADATTELVVGVLADE